MRYSSCTSTSYACRTADKYNNKYISSRSINLTSISRHPSHHTFLERNRYIFYLKCKLIQYICQLFNNILLPPIIAHYSRSLLYTMGKRLAPTCFHRRLGLERKSMLPHPLAVFSVLRLSSDSYSRLLRVSALM